MLTIAQIGVGEGTGEDVVEEEDYDETEEEGEGEEKRRGVQVAPDSKFLVVIVRFYEPNEIKAKHFQPYVVGSIIDGVTIKPKAKKGKKEKPLKEEKFFQIKKRDLLMLFWELENSSKAKDPIHTKVRGNILSAQIRGIETRLLGEFNSEESVSHFADALIKMTESTN